MQLTFLGTGTSQGVPMIAHPNEGLNLANSKNWRTRSSVHVELAGDHIQVDAAPEFRLQCLANGIDQVDYFILTHGHSDHVVGMDDLRRFCDLRGGEALPVYSSREGLERVRQCFPYAIRERCAVRGYPAFALEEMPGILTLPGGGIIRSVRLPHGPIEVLGLVFEEPRLGRKVAYYCDCKEVTPEALALASGADTVILDGLRPQPHPSHMSIEEAVETARIIGAPQTWLTHMTYQIDYAEWSEKLPAGVMLAYDGLTLRW